VRLDRPVPFSPEDLSSGTRRISGQRVRHVTFTFIGHLRPFTVTITIASLSQPPVRLPGTPSFLIPGSALILFVPSR
jgi:hypothetical protein